MDYIEPCCCFDSRLYTGIPDAEPCRESIDVPAAIRELDGLYNSGREAEAGVCLERFRDEARAIGDWRGELSMLSELLGYHRRDGNREKAMRAVNEALDIIRVHRMGATVSGATVLLNAATTLKAFGRAAESLPIFEHVSRVYADNLDPTDYRFAGLYNNMGLSCEDVGDYPGAERCFRLALGIIPHSRHPENELAVTWCNLAELYDRQDPEDPRIGDCVEQAWACLNAPSLPRDGYHAFTISKCAPSFDYLGYFLYSRELKERAERIYAGT
jgi:tetratricopeptide (TPR) repeat protein